MERWPLELGQIQFPAAGTKRLHVTMQQQIDYSAFQEAEGPREVAEAFEEHGQPAQAFDTVVTLERDNSMGKELVENLASLAGWELFGVDLEEFTLSDGSWREQMGDA